MFNAFITPAAGWRPPQQAPKTPPSPPCDKSEERDWQDYAGRERWEEAIIAYLRTDFRKTFPLWSVVNAIVAESCQRSRFDVRAATFECLRELMRLCRERRVFRHRRRWIAILDMTTPLPPLEAESSYCPRSSRGDERC